MEQDNEIRKTDSGRPVENDLFDIHSENASAVQPLTEPVSETAGEPTAAETVPVSQPAPEPAAQPVGEPEFKVNPEDRPTFRLLNSSFGESKANSAEYTADRPKISLRSNPDSSLGRMLVEARTAAGFSVQDASRETRIRSDYIEALENDRTDDLPNPVFLRAYVRALIRLYALDSNSAARIEEQMADVQPPAEVPEKLLEEIGKDGQISEAETRRIKMILIYGSIILLLLISLTVTSIVTVSIRSRHRQPQQQQAVPPFDSGRIEQLIPPPIPQTQVLPVPAPAEAKPAGR